MCFTQICCVDEVGCVNNQNENKTFFFFLLACKHITYVIFVLFFFVFVNVLLGFNKKFKLKYNNLVTERIQKNNLPKIRCFFFKSCIPF